MFETSQDVAALFEALSAFQGAVAAPKKGSVNPHFNRKYADLAEVIEVAKEPLSQHGLSYFQLPMNGPDGSVCVLTQLNHKSGQWIRSSYSMPVGQRTPQAVGTAITYARRYALQAILGLAAEDDDGNAASQPEPAKAQPSTAKPPETKKQEQPEPKPEAPTDEQRAKVRELLKACGAANPIQAGALAKELAGCALSEISRDKADAFIVALGKRAIALKEAQS